MIELGQTVFEENVRRGLDAQFICWVLASCSPVRVYKDSCCIPLSSIKVNRVWWVRYTPQEPTGFTLAPNKGLEMKGPCASSVQPRHLKDRAWVSVLNLP